MSHWTLWYTRRKDNIRRKYLTWLIAGPFDFNPAGKKKASSRNFVLRWVKEGWNKIPADMVMNSFKSCGISNALDGTEDDAVYEDEEWEIDEDEDMQENAFETDSEDEESGE